MTRYAAPPVSTAPNSSQLRPLALGELIDRSATFWRAHLKPLFLLCLGFELVNYTLSKGVLLLMERAFPILQGGPALQARANLDPIGTLGELGLSFLSLSALALYLLWSYWLALMAVTRYVMGAQLGEPVRPMESFKHALGRMGSLTGAFLLSLLWALGMGLLMVMPGGILMVAGAVTLATQSGSMTVVGSLLLGIGGLLAALGALAAILYYFLRFAVLAPVLVMEDGGAFRSFGRSGRLMSGRVEPGIMGLVKMRGMVLTTVVAGILFAVSIVSGLPAWLVRLVYGNPLDPTSAANAVPETLLVPVELLQAVGQSFFTPLGLVFYAMLYLDLRMRREGLDLERRLDARANARATLAAA